MNLPTEGFNSPPPAVQLINREEILNSKKIVSMFVKVYSFPLLIFVAYLVFKIIRFWDFINDPKYPDLTIKLIAIKSISIFIILFSYGLIGLSLGRFINRHFKESWPTLIVKLVAVSALIAMALPFEIAFVYRVWEYFIQPPVIHDLVLIVIFLCFWVIFTVLNIVLVFISRLISINKA